MKSIVPGSAVFLCCCISLVCGFSTAVADISGKKWEILDPVLAYSTDEVGWSLETVHALQAVGIDYVGSLVDKTEKELPPDFTLKSLTEIKSWLAERGLGLGMNISWPSDESPTDIFMITQLGMKIDTPGKIREAKLVRKLRLNFTEGRNPVFARPIDSMPWSTRTKNALKDEEIYYIGALVKMTEGELEKVPNLGAKSLDEVINWLEPRGLEPGINPHWPSGKQEEKEWVNKLNLPNSLDELPENIKLILAQRIDRLDWKPLAKMVLKGEGIYYIGSLVKMTRAELIRVPNFSSKNINEITDWLTSKGLWLGMNIPWPSDKQEEKELVNKLNPPDSLEELSENAKWILTQSIDNMDWSLRIKNALKNEEIYYIEVLVKMTEEELQKIPNLGKKSIDEIKDRLTSGGLRLGMNIDWPSNPEQEQELIKKLNPFQDVPEELIPILARPIDSVDWAIRTKLSLTNVKIDYIGALVKMTEEELRKFVTLNKKSFTEIKDWLAQRGLRLGMNISWPSDKTEEAELVNGINTYRSYDSQKETEWVQKLNPIEERKGVGNGFLTPLEEQVLKMRFGIGEDSRTLKEIGEILNLTQQKILQIQNRALQTLYKKGIGINPDILYHIGIKFYEGERVNKKPYRAAEFWKKASDQGHADAQYSLGYLYSKGEGVGKDMEQAIQLWKKAAAQGHEEAQRSLDEQEQCSLNLFQKLNKK